MTIPRMNALLPDSTLVETQLLTLQDVSVDTSTLAGAGSNHGVQTTGFELLLKSRFNLAISLEAGLLLLLDSLAALLVLNELYALLCPSASQAVAVVGLVPLSERRGIDLDDSGFGKGVGTDQLVVRRVEDDTDHADLAGNALRSP